MTLTLATRVAQLVLSAAAVLQQQLLAEAAVEADAIQSLPGWDGALPSKHYSGYLDARGGTRHMHYYLQLSEGNPKTDPVTLWMNGGPGCTSLKGGFEELGQLVFNRESFTANKTQAPKMYYNPQGWTKLSNMIYFESPPGVGFSYCDECTLPKFNESCRCVATDVSTAEENYDALVSFFKGFPEFKENDFYITGESYAGQYIPTLMDQIHSKGGVNLKGAAIGNGVGGGNTFDKRVKAKFYLGKGMISDTLGAEIITECGSLEYPPGPYPAASSGPPVGGPTPSAGPGWANPSAACTKALGKISAQVGPHNLYNVDDFCPSMNPDEPGPTLDEWEAAMVPNADGSLPRMDKLLHERPSGAGEGGTMPLGAYERWCGVDDAMMTWLMVPEVMEALHVAKPKGTEKNNLQYMGGSYPPYGNSTYDTHDYRQLYKMLAEHYRLWIYNGQDDGCVPYIGAQEWTARLGFPETTAWHPWFTTAVGGGRRVAAGYSTSFGGAAKDFTFMTIKGSGHEAPTYKPAASFTMFAAFLNGTRL